LETNKNTVNLPCKWGNQDELDLSDLSCEQPAELAIALKASMLDAEYDHLYHQCADI
jgi:hypothetical protein